jgi:hypothetical protein
MMNQHKFIFLCGLHRSGTSPLFRILREHPQISGFSNTGVPEDEGQHLQTVFPAAKVYGGPGKFGFAPAAHLTEHSDLITPENKKRLFEEWSRHWDLSRRFLLEKSPPNIIRGRFLQAIFPNAYFIIIARHPIAVSLATWKWARCSLDSLMEHWLHCHRLFEHDRPRLERTLLVKYEDLIQATEPALNQAFEFLGVRAHASPPLDPGGNARYFSAWRSLSTGKKGAALCRSIVAKYEEQVRPYGYSLVDCEATVPVVSSGHKSEDTSFPTA